jgi:hypothetical protein
MVTLSIYLGHSKVADTYWYLEATPYLMRSIADCGALRSNQRFAVTHEAEKAVQRR